MELPRLHLTFHTVPAKVDAGELADGADGAEVEMECGEIAGSHLCSRAGVELEPSVQELIRGLPTAAVLEGSHPGDLTVLFRDHWCLL